MQRSIDVLSLENQKKTTQKNNTQSFTSYIPDHQENINETQKDDLACGIPAEKAVPLPKWPKAIICRWKKTLEKPVSFELKVRLDMKEWYDPNADGTDASSSPFLDQLKEWKDQRSSLKL